MASPQVSGEPPRIGEIVGGKYRILRLLAEGGMGVVYEAQHEVVRRRFAVKFLRADFARRREYLGRFKREAEAAGALESENIASAVDFGIATDGSPFIVMEYLVGEDLATLLAREGRLPLERAADLCLQASLGAEVAHAAGILHRDLKPKNLFIARREDGTDLLKILDFGIAKLAPVRYDHSTTDTGAVLGTPAYMSPEHARGEKKLDARSDVYALGAILFEMVSGRLPHPGESANAILYHISTSPAGSLADAVPAAPQPLIDLVDSALATDSSRRPPSAKAFALSIAPFAQRKVWPEPIPTRDGPLDELGSGQLASSHWWSRRLVLLTAALALGVGGAGAIRRLWPKEAPHSAPMPSATVSSAETGLKAAAGLLEPVPAPSPEVAPAAPTSSTSPSRPEPASPPKRDGRLSGRPQERPRPALKTAAANEPSGAPSDSNVPTTVPAPRVRDERPQEKWHRKNPYPVE